MEFVLNIDNDLKGRLEIHGEMHPRNTCADDLREDPTCENTFKDSKLNGDCNLPMENSNTDDDEPISRLISEQNEYTHLNGNFTINEDEDQNNSTPEMATCTMTGSHVQTAVNRNIDTEERHRVSEMDDQDEPAKAQGESAFPSPSRTPEENDMEEEPIYKTSRLLRKQSAVLSKSACDERDERAAEYKKIASTLLKPDMDRTPDERTLLAQNPDTVQLILQRKRNRDARKRREVEFEDSADELERKCAILAQAIAQSRHLVVYTGAGISTSAKIPDYRGSNGIWTRLQQGKDIGNHDLSLAEPTYTHMALYELYRQNILKYVVSQNCDGLHLRSGLPRNALSEVHGNMYMEVCKTCKPTREYWRLFDVTEHTGRYSHKTMRRCYMCNGALEDTIVHFGERGKLQWPLNWAGASKNARSATTIVCLGSSLKVLKKYPWLWQMDKPAKRRPNLYIVNLQWTPKDECANVKIHGKCDEIMRRVMRMLGIEVPEYNRDLDPIFTHGTPLCSEEMHTITQPFLTLPAKKDDKVDIDLCNRPSENDKAEDLTIKEDSQDSNTIFLENKPNLDSNIKPETETERRQLPSNKKLDSDTVELDLKIALVKSEHIKDMPNGQNKFEQHSIEFDTHNVSNTSIVEDPLLITNEYNKFEQHTIEIETTPSPGSLVQTLQTDIKLLSPMASNPDKNNETDLPTFTIESYLAARPNLLFNQALLNYCTLVPSMDSTQQYVISPMITSRNGSNGAGNGYSDLLFYPIHTNMLYSGLHSIISPPPLMLRDGQGDMDDDLPQDLSTRKYTNTPFLFNSAPVDTPDPLLVPSPEPACSYCHERCNSYSCQFYDKMTPTFRNQRFRRRNSHRKTKRQPKQTSEDRLVNVGRPLYCICCDVSSEAEDTNCTDDNSDSESPTVEKMHKIQAGWFGKGYKKYRRCKRRYP